MICGILLAAGSANRFGSNKLLYPLPDGIPIGVAAARHLKQSVDHTIAVVRSDDVRLTALLHFEGLTTVVSKYAERGMSTSLVSAIRASKNADGWLITLADMPWISPQTISTIAMMMEDGADIAVPYYDGHRGHPVGFSHKFLPDLLCLTGDKGASDLLQANIDLVKIFHSDDVGILQDIDRPRDVLASLRTAGDNLLP
ncbi:MAG: nucleotidyltransferase family protein [Piscirickettsiaceae bacterium]|nr:nucleotidyltransferase family protein [Piscirickettsiaceae bacterium]